MVHVAPSSDSRILFPGDKLSDTIIQKAGGDFVNRPEVHFDFQRLQQLQQQRRHQQQLQLIMQLAAEGSSMLAGNRHECATKSREITTDRHMTNDIDEILATANSSSTSDTNAVDELNSEATSAVLSSAAGSSHRLRPALRCVLCNQVIYPSNYLWPFGSDASMKYVVRYAGGFFTAVVQKVFVIYVFWKCQTL